MKILFIHSLSDINLGGGAEHTLWTLMRTLRDRGHKCVLLATSDQKGLQRSQIEGITVWLAGIKNVYWPHRKERPHVFMRLLWHLLDVYNPWMQSYIRQVIQEEKPDVASVHNLPGWSSSTWTALKELSIPVVQVLHDHYTCCVKATMYSERGICKSQCFKCKLFRLPHITFSTHLDAVVGISNYILKSHLDKGYFRNVPISKVVYNCRNRSYLGVQINGEASLSKDLVIGYIGRLDPAKGIEMLIDAYLQANLPSSQLWIAGDGKKDYEKYLKNKTSCNPRIVFMGRVKPSEFYPKIDILVVPSIWHEPQGMVIPEAFAFGKPVIASKRGGIPEMINDGENGLLFDPDNTNELVSCISRLYYNQNLRHHLSENGRKSGSYFWNIDSWSDAYEELYRQVINQKYE